MEATKMCEQAAAKGPKTVHYGDGSKFIQGKNNFGTLIRQNRILDGEIHKRKLHGSGCERTLNPETNLLLNDFIGSFRNGKRNGEGQCFYDNGIYDGAWRNNQRSGRGIMWYQSDELYFGEWKNDVYEGNGVLVKVNGNRYEGSFSNGMKHGEGTFYHCQTGQAQKGIWVNDVCKCSMMQDDEIRFRAAHPTPFPIPEVKLANPTFVVAQEFQNVLNSVSCVAEPTRE